MMTHNPPPLNTHACTHTRHTYTQYTDTQNSLPLLPSSTDREEYVQAVLLMHIYTEHTNSPTQRALSLSKGYCV